MGPPTEQDKNETVISLSNNRALEIEAIDVKRRNNDKTNIWIKDPIENAIGLGIGVIFPPIK